MRKFIVPIIALASIAAAAPATAQYWGGNQGQGVHQRQGNGIQQRIRAVSFQIDRLSQRGALTNAETRSLRRELGWVAGRAQRYRWDDDRRGYDRGEQRDLWNRLARLEQRVRYEARDGDRRYSYNDRDRDGVPNRYDRYDNNPYRR